ncbi:hypothetical protein ABKN59_009473 [Abortiporus biennis]
MAMRVTGNLQLHSRYPSDHEYQTPYSQAVFLKWLWNHSTGTTTYRMLERNYSRWPVNLIPPRNLSQLATLGCTVLSIVKILAFCCLHFGKMRCKAIFQLDRNTLAARENATKCRQIVFVIKPTHDKHVEGARYESLIYMTHKILTDKDCKIRWNASKLVVGTISISEDKCINVEDHIPVQEGDLAEYDGNEWKSERSASDILESIHVVNFSKIHHQFVVCTAYSPKESHHAVSRPFCLLSNLPPKQGAFIKNRFKLEAYYEINGTSEIKDGMKFDSVSKYLKPVRNAIGHAWSIKLANIQGSPPSVYIYRLAKLGNPISLLSEDDLEKVENRHRQIERRATMDIQSDFMTQSAEVQVTTPDVASVDISSSPLPPSSSVPPTSSSTNDELPEPPSLVKSGATTGDANTISPGAPELMLDPQEPVQATSIDQGYSSLTPPLFPPENTLLTFFGLVMAVTKLQKAFLLRSRPGASVTDATIPSQTTQPGSASIEKSRLPRGASGPPVQVEASSHGSDSLREGVMPVMSPPTKPATTLVSDPKFLPVSVVIPGMHTPEAGENLPPYILPELSSSSLRPHQSPPDPSQRDVVQSTNDALSNSGAPPFEPCTTTADVPQPRSSTLTAHPVVHATHQSPPTPVSNDVAPISKATKPRAPELRLPPVCQSPSALFRDENSVQSLTNLLGLSNAEFDSEATELTRPYFSSESNAAPSSHQLCVFDLESQARACSHPKVQKVSQGHVDEPLHDRTSVAHAAPPPTFPPDRGRAETVLTGSPCSRNSNDRRRSPSIQSSSDYAHSNYQLNSDPSLTNTQAPLHPPLNALPSFHSIPRQFSAVPTNSEVNGFGRSQGIVPRHVDQIHKLTDLPIVNSKPVKHAHHRATHPIQSPSSQQTKANENNSSFPVFSTYPARIVD